MTRGTMRFGSTTVQVMFTDRTDGGVVGSITFERKQSGDGSTVTAGYQRVQAPTNREAWAELSRWFAEQIDSGVA